ncbi:hypothetical protein [uncultured Limosilactobacillus sp.]|uniref:hypothetical protein n=1 Tax=uncultured Limosilactobacillus sp. TaxID=2837629 RepID=UPI0025D90551|nr:hypothetical protein [uncultured Limosilactobacillus sp.]
MEAKETQQFVKHLVVTNIYTLLVIGIYNLLGWILPLVKISFAGVVIVLLILNSLLVILKLINNFDFGANR